jgi:hypothetical protein
LVALHATRRDLRADTWGDRGGLVSALLFCVDDVSINCAGSSSYRDPHPAGSGDHEGLIRMTAIRRLTAAW